MRTVCGVTAAGIISGTASTPTRIPVGFAISLPFCSRVRTSTC